jgi:hypothetical protein
VIKKLKLSASMTLSQFDNGYWYATELKDFARTVGIPFSHRLRKDELENAIKQFLTTGKIESSNKLSRLIPATRDVDLGLSLSLPVARYTNDKTTKDFLDSESRKLVPGLKRKSGARYRLNRWREVQLAKGLRITYGDVVREYVRLNQTSDPFARIPSGRYINFLSDFLRSEQGATRAQALRAWQELKSLDAPKNYRSWQKFQKEQREITLKVRRR